MGAVTALGAAYRRPDLSSTVVGHDPAIDWLPDEIRKALLHERFGKDDDDDLEPERKSAETKVGDDGHRPTITYSGGTGGYESNIDVSSESYKKGVAALRALDMFVLYSGEFMDK